MQLKRDVAEYAVTSKVPDRQQLLAMLVCRFFHRKLIDCPAHHIPNHAALRNFTYGPGGNVLAVPQHSDTVGNAKDFVEPVADINNRNTTRPKSLHDFH